MATSMEKKIAELEMGLLHLQQNIDIPGTATGTGTATGIGTATLLVCAVYQMKINLFCVLFL
jgi:hypothetical protein